MDYKQDSMVQRAINKIDRYGIPLNLNYNGKRTYQSKLGFALTIIQITIVIIYMGFQIRTVNNRGDIKIYSSETFLGDQINRKANLSSKDLGFSVRIQYYGANRSWFADEVYTLFSPSFGNDLVNGTVIDQPIKVIAPDNNTFTSMSLPPSSTINWVGEGVIVTTQSDLKGFLKLDVLFCQQYILDTMFPGKKCKSEQEALDAITGVQVYIETKYQYFDSNNFTQPLKWKTSLSAYGLSKSFSHSLGRGIREKNLKLGDSLWNSDFWSDELTYYDLKDNTAYFVNDITYKKRMLTYRMVLDETTELTIREVRNYAQACSAIGGLLGFITVISMALVNFFVRSKIDVDLITHSFRLNDLKGRESLKSNTESLKQLFSKKSANILTLKESICLKLTACCPLVRTRNFKLKQKIYERATEKIAQEVSIQNLIMMSRMTKLLTKILLPTRVRVLSKELLFKEITLDKKTKFQKHITCASDQDLQKLLSKKGSIYKRFIKYALKPFNHNKDIFMVDGIGGTGGGTGRDSHRKQKDLTQHGQFEKAQHRQSRLPTGPKISNNDSIMPIISKSKIRDSLQVTMKKRSRKTLLDIENPQTKHSSKNQLPLYENELTDDLDYTLRKLK